MFDGFDLRTVAEINLPEFLGKFLHCAFVFVYLKAVCFAYLFEFLQISKADRIFVDLFNNLGGLC